MNLPFFKKTFIFVLMLLCLNSQAAEPTTISPYAKKLGIASATTFIGATVGLYGAYLNKHSVCAPHLKNNTKSFATFIKELICNLQNPQTRSATLREYPTLNKLFAASGLLASSAIASQLCYKPKAEQPAEKPNNPLIITISKEQPEIQEKLRVITIENSELIQQYQALVEAQKQTALEQRTKNELSTKAQTEAEEQIKKLQAEQAALEKQLKQTQQNADLAAAASTKELLQRGAQGVIRLEENSRTILELEQAATFKQFEQMLTRAQHKEAAKKLADQLAQQATSEEQKDTEIARLNAELEAKKQQAIQELAALQTRIDQMNTALASAEQQNKNAIKENNNLSAAARAQQTTLAAEIDRLKKALLGAQKAQRNTQQQATTEQERLAKELAAAQASIRAHQDKIAEQQATAEQTAQAQAKSEENQQALRDKINELELALQAAHQQANLVNNDLDAERLKLAQAEQAALTKQSELDALIAQLRKGLQEEQAQAQINATELNQQLEHEKNARHALEQELAKIRLTLESSKKANRQVKKDTVQRLAEAELLLQNLQQQAKQQQLELDRTSTAKTRMESVARQLQEQAAKAHQEMLSAQRSNAAEQEKSRELHQRLQQAQQEHQRAIDAINEAKDAALRQEQIATREATTAFNLEKLKVEEQAKWTAIYKTEADALREQQRINALALQTERAEIHKKIARLEAEIKRLTGGAVRGTVSVLGDLTGLF